jgi:hypothetical protein
MYMGLMMLSRQVRVHTAEQQIPEPSASEVELAIEKLKGHKSPGIYQIPAELIKAGGRTIRCETNKVIISIWNKEELPEEWKGSIIIPKYIKRAMKLIVVIIGAYVGRPNLRWMAGVKRDAERLGVRNWRTKAMDRDGWRLMIESAKTLHGL